MRFGDLPCWIIGILMFDFCRNTVLHTGANDNNKVQEPVTARWSVWVNGSNSKLLSELPETPNNKCQMELRATIVLDILLSHISNVHQDLFKTPKVQLDSRDGVAMNE